MHVVIAGAGVGGLCLAQGLRKNGIEATVLERDPSAHARFQGLRLRIDAHGRAALAACLPDNLYELAMATANPLYMSRGIGLDEQLREIFSVAHPGGPVDPARASTVVNRKTLRQILLTGLGDHVHFDTAVIGYETGERVRVHTADGTTWVADVLVGADGIGSAVRGQLLPEIGLLDTGLRAIYGQMNLDLDNLSWVPPVLFGGSRPVLAPGPKTLACGIFQPQTEIGEAVRRFAPGSAIDPVRSYLKWTLVAPREVFGVDEPAFFALTPAQLHALALEHTTDWSPLLRRIMAESLVEEVFPLSIRVTEPGVHWSPSRVTLLGDAIHATAPVGGIGANTALRDAAGLTEHLALALVDGVDPVAAIGRYEAEMRDYGYAAVRNSLHGSEQLFRTGPLVEGGAR
ncbi:FAD-dependent oxidoreductase [Nocardia vulneris]|uniref:FAD-binding protein n=1 Tax=Nocardia vulneris TaxID=1141657 RepID=A0ABR4ZJ67_9NOCA|nr:NAD(P)/FAD-dependent oxidoreductase [Nocardia vulneris]KIA65452.1 FAD-binding protein [Nocardia vulneris]